MDKSSTPAPPPGEHLARARERTGPGPQPFAPLAATDDFCDALFPPQPGDLGFWCLAEPGHPGDHASYGTQSDTVPLCTWPQDPPETSRQGGGLSGDTGASPPGTPAVPDLNEHWAFAAGQPGYATELAPRAADGEPACEATRPASRGTGLYTCLAAPGHAGDHVPYGAEAAGGELRDYTWPQDLPGFAAELDGTETGGRANLAGFAAKGRPGYTCGDCGGRGSEPTHVHPCWRLYIAKLRAAPEVAEARRELAAFGELASMSRLSSYDSARYLAAQALLSHQLRAVLAVIDRQAGAL